MKKVIAILLVLASLGYAAFAQDEAEKSTALEGTIVSIQASGDLAKVMLRLANGDNVTVELPQGEVARLRLRARDRIKVGGIFVGAIPGTRTQSRILARTMVLGGKEVAVANPVRLTEQDRLQIRAYAENQLKTQDQLRTQTQDQSRTGAPGQSGGSGEADQAQTGKK